jgi:hypothetical protein
VLGICQCLDEAVTAIVYGARGTPLCSRLLFEIVTSDVEVAASLRVSLASIAAPHPKVQVVGPSKNYSHRIRAWEEGAPVQEATTTAPLKSPSPTSIPHLFLPA